MYDFANLFFAGPCNARCPACIGKQIDPRLNIDNLDEFPLRNLPQFLALIRRHGVHQVVFSGTTTDPQLYRHERRLLAYLRDKLPVGTQLALHTNGRLALRKMDTFNLYDRVCLSLPSFEPETYHRMMGVPGVPDLAEILHRSRKTIKISYLVDKPNAAEIPSFLERCLTLGIQRVVLRKKYDENRPWAEMGVRFPEDMRHTGFYRNNPVYDFRGVQVTLWDFGETASTSLNLFSSGVISEAYLLIKGAGG